MRRAHRIVGIIFGVFILNAAITGLFWAYGPKTYWKSGYMEAKRTVDPEPITRVRVTPVQAAVAARSKLGSDPVIAVQLRADGGRWIYEVQAGAEKKPRSVLVSTVEPKVISPISEEVAVETARRYIAGAPAVRSVVELAPYPHRNGKIYESAYKIAFDQPNNPEIIIDRNSGRILEDQDRSRRFHFLIMQLHQLNFFGFKKTLTAIPGLSLLAMIVTGIWVWAATRPRTRKRLEGSL
jgi:hypothetical protein